MIILGDYSAALWLWKRKYSLNIYVTVVAYNCQFPQLQLVLLFVTTLHCMLQWLSLNKDRDSNIYSVTSHHQLHSVNTNNIIMVLTFQKLKYILLYYSVKVVGQFNNSNRTVDYLIEAIEFYCSYLFEMNNIQKINNINDTKSVFACDPSSSQLV